jgi:hypothetical protein
MSEFSIYKKSFGVVFNCLNSHFCIRNSLKVLAHLHSVVFLFNGPNPSPSCGHYSGNADPLGKLFYLSMKSIIRKEELNIELLLLLGSNYFILYKETNKQRERERERERDAHEESQFEGVF